MVIEKYPFKTLIHNVFTEKFYFIYYHDSDAFYNN